MSVWVNGEVPGASVYSAAPWSAEWPPAHSRHIVHLQLAYALEPCSQHCAGSRLDADRHILLVDTSHGRSRARLVTPTRIMLLFEVGSRPPHDGVRQSECYNLYRALGQVTGRCWTLSAVTQTASRRGHLPAAMAELLNYMISWPTRLRQTI